MREWSVLVESWAPKGKHGSLDIDDSRVHDLIDALAEWRPAVSAGPEMWSVQLSVEAEDVGEAIDKARELVETTANQCRMPIRPVERIEAVEAERLEAELEVPNFPKVLGTSEVAEVLGITPQRLHQLRSAGRFPQPMVELAATPLWLRTTVESFEAGWDRSPGRPRSPGPLPNDLPDLYEAAHGTKARQ